MDDIACIGGLWVGSCMGCVRSIQGYIQGYIGTVSGYYRNSY